MDHTSMQIYMKPHCIGMEFSEEMMKRYSLTVNSLMITIRKK